MAATSLSLMPIRVLSPIGQPFFFVGFEVIVIEDDPILYSVFRLILLVLQIVAGAQSCIA